MTKLMMLREGNAARAEIAVGANPVRHINHHAYAC